MTWFLHMQKAGFLMTRLIYGPGCENICFCSMETTKAQISLLLCIPEHTCSLISTIVVCGFDSTIQATLVISTMHSSTLSLTSTLKTGPDFIPYMFFGFQQRITRTTSYSLLWVIRHKFLVPVMNFRSFRINCP